MLLTPEIILFNTFKAVIKAVRDDYAANVADNTKSLLYQVLYNNSATTNDGKIQRYNLFEQAVKVFITTEDDLRHLDVNLFFNAKRASIPTLHITLPSEQEKNNSLGIGEGINEPLYIPDTTTPTAYKRTFNRRFTATTNLVITSDNTNEIVLIYHFIRSLIISLMEGLSLTGLENLKLSGGDININTDLVPQGIYSRVIGISYEYNAEGIELSQHLVNIFNNIVVNATIIIPE